MLLLEGLPKLESIYWSPLPFPFLKRIVKIECPKMRKFPLNATSVSRVDELSIIMKSEEEFQLEWEDEDTKNRFSPLISLRDVNTLQSGSMLPSPVFSLPVS
ncbi:unnamed protein product [Eruca vesicaria subsp. sativa]|uniref:Disease resistance protein n=1 Tax=Eruca vesicaria subsp. sativa TaxID=29727 RepID=A0ABC8JKC2_ERUVS|nr:unnamed protein product [Eruca vesicaria subsp. sativa]